jgi:protein-disulfide isomerase
MLRIIAIDKRYGQKPFPGFSFLVYFSRCLRLSLVLLLLGALPVAAEQGDIVAEVGSEAIKAGELEGDLALQLGKLHEQIYELKRKKLEELIADSLLRQEAENRGVTVQALLDAEVAAKVAPVTEREFESLYQQKKNMFRGPEKKIREQLESEILAQRTAARKETFIQQLRAERGVVVHLQPPSLVRVAIDGGDKAAFKGFPEAPVVIIEFADFQCPFCRKALSALEKVRAAYPKQVRLVYRHFPIDVLHPQARLAAQAAECAGAQGRFWEYHDRLFTNVDLFPAQLRELAKGLNLDVAAFEECLNGEWARGKVAQDVEAGNRAGVSGTPTFFINGRQLVGAQPFDAFRGIIEQELAGYRRESMNQK